MSKFAEVSHEMLVLVTSHVSLRVFGCAVSMGEAANLCVSGGVNVSKLEEVSHEMLVLRLARVWC